MTSSLIKCLDDTDFPVNISAAISLQPYITMEKCEPIIRSNLEHIIQRFVLILQRVAVESVMQTFDTLINHFSEEVMQMSIQIIQVLLHAFTEYTKDEDNDSAMFTAMSTLDCVSSVVMNACQEAAMYDSVVQVVLPAVMVRSAL